MNVPFRPTRQTRWILSALAIAVASGALLGVAYSQGRGLLGLRGLDHWSADERAQLASIQHSQLPPAKPDASNRRGKHPAAGSRGKSQSGRHCSSEFTSSNHTDLPFYRDWARR